MRDISSLDSASSAGSLLVKAGDLYMQANGAALDAVVQLAYVAGFITIVLIGFAVFVLLRINVVRTTSNSSVTSISANPVTLALPLVRDRLVYTAPARIKRS